MFRELGYRSLPTIRYGPLTAFGRLVITLRMGHNGCNFADHILIRIYSWAKTTYFDWKFIEVCSWISYYWFRQWLDAKKSSYYLNQRRPSSPSLTGHLALMCYSTTICKLVDLIPALRQSDCRIPNWVSAKTVLSCSTNHGQTTARFRSFFR